MTELWAWGSVWPQTSFKETHDTQGLHTGFIRSQWSHCDQMESLYTHIRSLCAHTHTHQLSLSHSDRQTHTDTHTPGWEAHIRSLCTYKTLKLSYNLERNHRQESFNVQNQCSYVESAIRVEGLTAEPAKVPPDSNRFTTQNGHRLLSGCFHWCFFSKLVRDAHHSTDTACSVKMGFPKRNIRQFLKEKLLMN